VDASGSAYVAGDTNSTNFPTANPVQATNGGAADAFVAKISTLKPPVCSAAHANPAALWSPNHQFVPIAVKGVSDPDGNAVTITITGVTQDEPVNGKGSGNTSPDAVIQGGNASVRAERDGNGNGRVYHISFRADDGKGDSCTGVVRVGVPIARGKESPRSTTARSTTQPFHNSFRHHMNQKGCPSWQPFYYELVLIFPRGRLVPLPPLPGGT